MKTSYAVLASLMLLIPIGVFAVTAQESQPNLRPTELVWDPGEPAPGQNVTFDATIENNGSADASTFNVTFLVDGERLGENVTVGGLAAGENVTVTSENWTVAEGEHIVTVVADSAAEITEEVEEDNELSETLTFRANLVPTEAAHAPEDAFEGQNVTFEATVENNGSADAGGFNVTFLVDGEQVGQNVTVDGLPTGQNTTVTSQNWTAVEGQHELTVQVDSDGNVTEANETDNELVNAFTVDPDEPDLVVTELTHSPGSPFEGQEVALTATVANQGNTAAENVTVRFMIDGLRLGGDKTIATLGPGDNTTITSEAWGSTEGEHDASATAEPGDEIEETDEANNTATHTFTVEPDEPDLVVSDITTDPAEPEAGQSVTLTATVENQGHTAAGNNTLIFRINGTQLGEPVNVSELAPGESVQVTSINWTASNGSHELEAQADAGDNVTEADETNNQHTETLAVGQAPNLVATDLAANETEPALGQNVTFEVTIEDDGELDAERVEVRFLVDGEQVGENVTVDGLAAGDTTMATSDNWTATDGEHTVEAIVDADEQVDEHDETDNTASTTVTVQADDGEGHEGEDREADQMTICHRPPGNPDNAHTITIGEPAWDAHEGHGDSKGECPDDEGTSDNENQDPSSEDGAGGNENEGQDDEEPQAEGNGRGNGNGQGPPDHARGNGRG